MRTYILFALLTVSACTDHDRRIASGGYDHAGWEYVSQVTSTERGLAFFYEKSSKEPRNEQGRARIWMKIIHRDLLIETMAELTDASPRVQHNALLGLPHSRALLEFDCDADIMWVLDGSEKIRSPRNGNAWRVGDRIEVGKSTNAMRLAEAACDKTITTGHAPIIIVG